LAVQLDHPNREGKLHLVRMSEAIEKALPAWAACAGRSILGADARGTIVAAAPYAPQMLGRQILEVLGPQQPASANGETTGTREITLADGEPALARVHSLKNPVGLLAVVQGRDDALANWRSTTALTVTLSATTGFVVLIFGFAFHWEATRARQAHLVPG